MVSQELQEAFNNFVKCQEDVRDFVEENGTFLGIHERLKSAAATAKNELREKSETYFVEHPYERNVFDGLVSSYVDYELVVTDLNHLIKLLYIATQEQMFGAEIDLDDVLRPILTVVSPLLEKALRDANPLFLRGSPEHTEHGLLYHGEGVDLIPVKKTRIARELK